MNPHASDGPGSPFEAWVLPPGVPPGSATPTPGLVSRILSALQDGHARLAARPWRDVAESIGGVAEILLDPTSPIRAQAIEGLALTTPLTTAMCELVLDGMARDWTAERLVRMVEAEGLDRPLDAPVPAGEGLTLRARGVPLTFHLGAGTVPGVAVTSMVRALLVKSAAWVKPGRGDRALPTVVAEAVSTVDPELAGALAVTYWPGAETPQEVLDAASVVVAYGGNDTVEALRGRLRATTDLVAYHHRLSLGMVAREAAGDPDVLSDIAIAVAAFDQRGCVSPHVLLLETGGERSTLDWCEALAEALTAVQRRLPKGTPSANEASDVHQLRGAAELRSAVDPGVRIWQGEQISWTVILDPRAVPGGPCSGRTVLVRPVADLGEATTLLMPFGPVLQSVGWAGPDHRALALAEDLGALGVTRVTAFAKQAFPPPWWRHDGRPPLAPLVRWTELDL